MLMQLINHHQTTNTQMKKYDYEEVEHTHYTQADDTSMSLVDCSIMTSLSLVSPPLLVGLNDNFEISQARCQESDDASAASDVTNLAVLLRALEDDIEDIKRSASSDNEGAFVLRLISGDAARARDGEAADATPWPWARDEDDLDLFVRENVSWMKKYSELKMYASEHGHADVPQSHSLGKWVHYWRSKMRKWEDSNRDDESLKKKMFLLKQIGLSSNIGKGKRTGRAVSQTNVQRWEQQFSALCRYKDDNGDCNVPADASGELKSLGSWVRTQRRAYAKFRAQGGTQESYSNQELKGRFERLSRIGFMFSVGRGRGERHV